MKTPFSIGSVAKKPLLAARRFPVSVFIAVAYVGLYFYNDLHCGSCAPTFYQSHTLFLLGMFISAAAAVWLEDIVRSRMRHAITAAITLLCGAYSLLHGGAGQDWIIEFTAIWIAALLALFFLPFLKKGGDNAFWNFTVDTAGQLALALIFGGVLCIGLYVAFEALDKFFDVNTYGFGNMPWVLSFFLAAPLYFLANIPNKAAKRREDVAINKPLKVFALYILIPIAAIYTVILYVYLAKIIITWELPSGMVSYMVSAIAFIGLLTAVLLYPARTTLPRYLGLILLPLFVLMSIGIIRRFNDYGVTVARCYVLLMNLWFYGVYAYLFVTKAKRVKWILISFAALTLIASVGPWSVTASAKRALLAEVNRLSVELYNADLPPDGTEAPDDGSPKAERLRNKVAYLRDMYGKEAAGGIIMPELSALHKKSDYRRSYVYGSSLNNQILHINNFNTLVHLNCYPDDTRNPNLKLNYSFDHDDSRNPNITVNYSVKKNLLYITIPEHGSTFTVPLAQISDNEENIYQGIGYAVIINALYVRRFEMADSVELGRLEGILLYNHASSDTAALDGSIASIRR